MEVAWTVGHRGATISRYLREEWGISTVTIPRIERHFEAGHVV